MVKEMKRKPKIAYVLVYQTNKAGEIKTCLRKPNADDRRLLRQGYLLHRVEK